MMKPIARFLVRTENGKPNLILGCCFKGTESVFDKNSVYEIAEIFGELIITKIGDSVVVESGSMPTMPRMIWGRSVNDLLSEGGKYMWLTKAEYEDHMKKNNNGDVA